MCNNYWISQRTVNSVSAKLFVCGAKVRLMDTEIKPNENVNMSPETGQTLFQNRAKD